MKKSIILLTLALFAVGITAQAQDLTSKKGETMLPEEGDYALGFDADPFLNYVGNFLNQGGNTAPSADFVDGSNLAIVGKMFKDAQTAYRGRVRLGFGSASVTNMVPADDGNGDVEDVRKTSYNAITLGAGMEKRRGNTRVQGLYGGEALISVRGNKTTREFGNSMGDGGAITTTNFNTGTSSFETNRALSNSSGTTFGITIRGFAGVEVFVFPKVSVAMEYGWGLGFVSAGSGENETESWDGSGVTTNTATGRKASGFGIDTDNSGGALTINFHF